MKLEQPWYDEATNPSNGWAAPDPLPYLHDDGTPDFALIADDVHDGFLEKGNDLPDAGPDDDGRLYLHVSDHGNLELFRWDAGRAEWVSLWSRV